MAWRVSDEKFADNLMGIPLYTVCCFNLVAYNIFSLSLIFVTLITVRLGAFLPGFILPGIHCISWTWVTISFPILGKFSAIISSNIFSCPFSLSLLLWEPYNTNVDVFDIVPEVSETLHVFSLFFLHSVLWQWFPPFFFPTHLFYCFIYSPIPSGAFFIFIIPLFNWLFFISSSSLLGISCIFSVCASILFLRSWIIFTTIFWIPKKVSEFLFR